MENQNITTKQLLREIISRLGLRGVQDLPLYDIFVWMGHALKHIGGYSSLETVRKKVQVSNYTGRWPQDMHAIIRIVDHPKFTNKRTGFNVSLESGEVEIIYERYPLDEEGFPLFPNNPSTIDAIIWFVGWYLSIQGKLPNGRLSPQYCESQWQWYCGQARAEGYVPSMDQWERIVNTFLRLVPLNNEYFNDFINLDNKETLDRDKPNSYGFFE